LLGSRGESWNATIGSTAFVVLSDNYRLDLVSSTEISNGTVGLQYRRHR
jgi:hypothetical protein